jgi:L-lactate dehydrogenase (cytochrome)
MGFFGALRSTVRFRRLEWRSVERRLASGVNVEALRELARRRLPRGVFDYIDGGAEDEVTLERNSSAFRNLEFRPRVLTDVSTLDPSTTIMGQRVSLPLILGPTGFTRIVSSEGELAVARAAARAGLPYTLSSLSTRSIEEVRAVSDGDLWFQVYVWRDKDLLASMLKRAAAAAYSTIVITVDTAVLGRRERDVRRGMTLPRNWEPRRSSMGFRARCGLWISCGPNPSDSPTLSGHRWATEPMRSHWRRLWQGSLTRP